MLKPCAAQVPQSNPHLNPALVSEVEGIPSLQVGGEALELTFDTAQVRLTERIR